MNVAAFQLSLRIAVVVGDHAILLPLLSDGELNALTQWLSVGIALPTYGNYQWMMGLLWIYGMDHMG